MSSRYLIRVQRLHNFLIAKKEPLDVVELEGSKGKEKN